LAAIFGVCLRYVSSAWTVGQNFNVSYAVAEVICLDITLGQVVYSRVGRDAGRKFIIFDIIDESYVLLADGDLRRIDKPKKKKLKHLEVTSNVIVALSEKIKNKLKVTNSDIRKALAEYENREHNT
jgi:large subunit ribosomal protein L14e